MRLRVFLALAAALAAVTRPAAAGPALLFDPEDGKILYADEPDSQWHPASLTKIMTAYVTFEAIKAGQIRPDSKIACSANALKVQPSKLGLPVGAEITVEVALQALIVKSANDVAIMLAEAVSGSEAAFVERMNAAARRLGMTRTNFVNTNGLPTPAQVTTARDLAKLGRAVLKDFPEYAPYWSMQEVTIGKAKLSSHNGLLKTFEGADGIKTGFICDSGFNVVASATRDGKRLIAVVLGEQTGLDRTLRAASLLEHGFQQLGWKQLFNSNTIDQPVPADAKGITSMRQSVVSWECGTGRAPKSVLAARKAKLKAAKAKAKEKAAKSAAAGTESTGAATATAAAPAAAASVKPAAANAKAAKPAGPQSGTASGSGGSGSAATKPAKAAISATGSVPPAAAAKSSAGASAKPE